MSKISLLAVLVLLAGFALPSPSHAQFELDAPGKPKTYILYTAEPQTVPAGKHAVLELRFQVLPEYHVNSHTPKSPYLIPTVLTLQAAGGVKADAAEYPAGTPYSFAFDPTDKLDVYAGNFIVKLPVVATPGDHTLDGMLRYQACDNASCYPPRTLPVKVVFTAK
jgi:hypothetical protein